MSSTHPSHHSHNYRILVVDDESGILSTYQEILAPSSQLPEEFSSLFGEGEHSPVLFEVEYASNGQNALEKVEQAQQDQHPYSVIFMDVRMPEMDGLTATRKIRELGGDYAQLAIIAMTANAFEEDIRECMDAGMNDFIAKPINNDKLREVIEQHSARENAPLKSAQAHAGKAVEPA